jgi:hypothetical protein
MGAAHRREHQRVLGEPIRRGDEVAAVRSAAIRRIGFRQQAEIDLQSSTDQKIGGIRPEAVAASLVENRSRPEKFLDAVIELAQFSFLEMAWQVAGKRIMLG